MLADMAHRTCSQNGTWFDAQYNRSDWSNYQNCTNLKEYEVRSLTSCVHTKSKDAGSNPHCSHFEREDVESTELWFSDRFCLVKHGNSLVPCKNCDHVWTKHY